MNPTFRTTMEAAEFDALITENAQLRAKLDKAREQLQRVYNGVEHTMASKFVNLTKIKRILEETKP